MEEDTIKVPLLEDVIIHTDLGNIGPSTDEQDLIKDPCERLNASKRDPENDEEHGHLIEVSLQSIYLV